MAKENNQAKEKILKKEERYNKETKEAIEELMEDLNQ